MNANSIRDKNISIITFLYKHEITDMVLGSRKQFFDNFHLFSNTICTGPVLRGVYSQNPGIF